MFTSLCQFVLGVSVAFSGNYYFFVVLRFLLAMVSSVFVCTVCGCVSVCVCALACNWGHDKLINVERHKTPRVPRESR